MTIFVLTIAVVLPVMGMLVAVEVVTEAVFVIFSWHFGAQTVSVKVVAPGNKVPIVAVNSRGSDVGAIRNNETVLVACAKTARFFGVKESLSVKTTFFAIEGPALVKVMK